MADRPFNLTVPEDNVVRRMIDEKLAREDAAFKAATEVNKSIPAADQAKAIPLAKENKVPTEVARRNLRELEAQKRQDSLRNIMLRSSSVSRLAADPDHGPIALEHADEIDQFERMLTSYKSDGVVKTQLKGLASRTVNQVMGSLASLYATEEPGSRDSGATEGADISGVLPFWFSEEDRATADQMNRTVSGTLKAMQPSQADMINPNNITAGLSAPWVSEEQKLVAERINQFTRGTMRQASKDVMAATKAADEFIAYKPIIDLDRDILDTAMRGESGAALVNAFAFSGEQIFTSIPDMIASALAPLYQFNAQQGRVAQAGAIADGRDFVSAGDMRAAGPTALAITAGERIGLGRMLNPGTGLTAPLKAGGVEAGTEAIQEGLENISTTAETKEGFSWTDTGKASLGGAIGGAPGAAVIATGKMVLDTYVLRAEKRQKDLVDLGDKIRNSKVGALSPDTLTALAQQIEKDGGPQMSVPAEKLVELFQSEGLTPEQIEQRFPEVAKAFADGLEGNAEVPLNAESIVKLVSLEGFEAISGDVRTGPNERTPNELKQDTKDFDTFVESLTDVEKKEAVRASIEAQLTKQLTAAGQEPRAAQVQARLWSSFFTTLDERNVKDPGATLARYRLDITNNMSTDTQALPDAVMMQQSSVVTRLTSISPNDFVFREEMQNRTDQVANMFPSSADMPPIVAANTKEGLVILDGHNRAAVARDRNDNINAVVIPGSVYSVLKNAGLDEVDIAHAALERAGEGNAASQLRQQFPGVDFLATEMRAEPVFDAYEESVNNRGTFDPQDPNILYQSEQGAQRAAPVADFLSKLNAREQALVNPIRTGKVPPKRLKGNQAAAKWLEKFFTGKAITDFTKEIDDKVLREIGNVMAAEAIYALENSGNAFDWYSQAMQRALSIVSAKWPLLADDAAAAEAGFGTAANARFVFTYIMAVTSQNLDVASNAAATNKAFDEMIARVKAGDFTMSRNWGTGDKQAAMSKNFAKFGPLIDAMPGATFPEKLTRLDNLFRRRMTVAEWVREMKADGVPYSKPGQTAMNAMVYGSSLLGPKIGNGFWQNLNGNFSPLTIDLWMRRTWGRLTGKSIGNEAALPAQRARLKASIARAINSPELDMDPLLEVINERRSVNAKIRSVEARTDMSKKDQAAQIRKLKGRLKDLEDMAADYRGIPAPEPWKKAYDKDNAQLAEYAKRLLKEWDKEYKKLREKYGKKVPAKMQPTWARAAKRIKADLTTPLDQVANGTQRRQIEKAVGYAQETLTGLGYEVTTADLQAILWYPEKELWGALTTELAVDEDGDPVIPPSPLNESYDTVFARILNAEGYETQQGTGGDQGGGGDGGTVAGRPDAGSGPDGPTGEIVLRQDVRAARRDGGGRDQGRGLAPLPGAPQVEGAAGPDPRLLAVAERYARENGIDLRRQGEFVEVDPERAGRIAGAYEQMLHAPQDPAVKEAYADLIRQTKAQYAALVADGYVFTFFDGATDPYGGNPWNAMRDLRANKRMAVYGTYDGYGTEGITGAAIESNPMLEDTGLRWVDQKGVEHPVTANDLFRAVHDAFGHGLEGAGFRARGEENAWQAHVRLFTGPAVGAITSETRGQNSWLNYGPYGENNRTAALEETVFAEQKTGLMPPWTWEEGRAKDEGPQAGPSSFQTLDQTSQSTQTTARGFIKFGPKRDHFQITLTGKADLSTFNHEMMHYALEVIQDLVKRGEASPQLVADLQKLRDFAGLKDNEPIERRHHEQIARAWEAYTMEGRAPSADLQGVFNRMRAWLVFIYKRLSALDVELTDEVRGVFDRLVASDEQIAEARTNIGWGKPLPKEALFLSDDEYDRYVEAHAKAGEAQQREVDAKLMLEAARETQAAWKEERQKVLEEEREKLAQTRGYRAWKLLSEGTGLADEAPGRTSLKIDPETVPAEWRRDTTGMTDEMGLPLEAVAEILGYDSGEQMLSVIAGAKMADRDLPARVKQIMAERHGDMDATALADLAMAAVHSDDTQEVTLTEFRAMAQKAGIGAPPPGLTKWMAAQAQQKVLGLTRRQLDPMRWRRAELKAATDSAKAAAKGDMTKAAIHKRQQLMAAAMYRATVQADKRVDVIRKKLMPFTKNDRRAKLGKAGDLYLDGIDEILEAIQLKPMSAASVQKLDRLQKLVDEANANGEPLVLPDKLRAMLGRKNFQDMTLEELEGVHDAVMNIWHLAKLKNELKARNEKRQLEEALTEMEANAAAALGSPEIKDKFVYGWKDKAASKMREFRAGLVKMEFLFGWLDGKPDGGLMHRLIYQPIADANKAKFVIMKRFHKSIIQHMRNLPADQKARWDSKRTFLGREANGATIISAALNLGNEGNKSKLLKGYGLNMPQGEQQLMAEINAFMTKADWDFVQHIWDEIDTLWPDIARVTKAATGLEPEKIVPTPIATPFGTYQGGYYPVVYDPAPRPGVDAKKTLKQFERQQEGEGLFSTNFVSPTLGDGFTKARVDFDNPPILLDLKVISQHLSEVVHYVTHYEAITQADKITRHPRFIKLVQGTMGDEFYKTIRPWLTDIARDQDTPAVTRTEPFAKAMRYLRGGMSIGAMGYNVFTGFKQLLGVTTSLDAVKAKYLLSGLQKAWLSPNIVQNWKTAFAQSGELEPLVTQFDRDIKMINDIYAKQGIRSKFDKFNALAFAHIGWLQASVNVATWYGAKEQAIAEGLTEQQAIDRADAVVRQTQSAGAVKDLSPIQRGSEINRNVSMFYSWFNVLYNRMEDIHKQTKGARDLPKAAYRVGVLIMMTAMIEETASRAYEAIVDNVDDDDEEAGFILTVLMKSADTALAAIPLVRAFVSVEAASGGLKPEISPVVRVGADYWRTIEAIKDLAIEQEAPSRGEVKTAMRTVSVLTHVPVSGLYNLIDEYFGEEIFDERRKNR